MYIEKFENNESPNFSLHGVLYYPKTKPLFQAAATCRLFVCTREDLNNINNLMAITQTNALCAVDIMPVLPIILSLMNKNKNNFPIKPL